MDLRLRRRILLFLTLVCSAAGAFADSTYHQKETDDYVTLGDLTVEPGSGEEYELTVNLNGLKSTRLLRWTSSCHQVWSR